MALSTLLAKHLNLSSSKHHPLSPAPPLPPAPDLLSSAVTSFLPTYLKKYNSLHFSSSPTPPSSMDTHPSAATSDYHADVDMLPSDDTTTVDLASVYAAQRFFFPPPGFSNSITSSTAPPPALHSDFRRSMEAAVAAYNLQDALTNWPSLQDLLFHYLSINPDCTHNLIVDAFADIFVSLMPPSSETDSTTSDSTEYDVEMAAAYASHRFFISPPGSSNSIFDSTTSSSPENQERKPSPDLYHDFRRSMEAAVAAYRLHDVMANWQGLQEMLLRYLSQNPEDTHKFIVAAFADVLVSLMSPSSAGGGEADLSSGQQSFFTCAGASSSMDDDDESESSSESGGGKEAGEVVVQTYSPDPYGDFRRSMEEMVEARELHNVVANWNSLRELLLRYLSLNPESTHKFIISAFADLLVSLMSPPAKNEVAGEAKCLSGSLSSCGMSL